MKQAIFAVVILAVSLTSYADPRRPGRGHRGPQRPQHRPMPRPPMPRPMPAPIPRPAPMRFCEAVMLDQFHRVVRRYTARTPYMGVCHEAMRQCQWDLNRMGRFGYRCATSRF